MFHSFETRLLGVVSLGANLFGGFFALLVGECCFGWFLRWFGRGEAL